MLVTSEASTGVTPPVDLESAMWKGVTVTIFRSFEEVALCVGEAGVVIIETGNDESGLALVHTLIVHLRAWLRIEVTIAGLVSRFNITKVPVGHLCCRLYPDTMLLHVVDIRLTWIGIIVSSFVIRDQALTSRVRPHPVHLLASSTSGSTTPRTVKGMTRAHHPFTKGT